jgi:hypothetical protein
MFDLIRTKPDGTNVYEAMDRLQLDIVTDVFLGKSINSLTMERSPIQDAIDRLVEMSMLRIRVGYVDAMGEVMRLGDLLTFV